MTTTSLYTHGGKDGWRNAREIRHMMGNKRVWASLIAVAILLAVAGCQRSRTIGGDPLAESVRSKIRDVGLALARFEPEIDVRAYSSTVGGIAKGGARGAASGHGQDRRYKLSRGDDQTYLAALLVDCADYLVQALTCGLLVYDKRDKIAD